MSSPRASILVVSILISLLSCAAAPPSAIAQIPPPPPPPPPPTPQLLIDESTEASTPTVTPTVPNFVSATVVPTGAEAWTISVVLSGTELGGSLPTISGIELLEPITGAISDSFAFTGTSRIGSGPTTYTFVLFSDNEIGTITRADACLGGHCSQVVESGDFQLAVSGIPSSGGAFDVLLKSDLADVAPPPPGPPTVPEPSTLLLLASALASLAPWARQWGRGL